MSTSTPNSSQKFFGPDFNPEIVYKATVNELESVEPTSPSMTSSLRKTLGKFEIENLVYFQIEYFKLGILKFLHLVLKSGLINPLEFWKVKNEFKLVKIQQIKI